MWIWGQTWVPEDGSAGMIKSFYMCLLSQRLALSCLIKPGISGTSTRNIQEPVHINKDSRIARRFQPASPDRADPSSGMVLKFLGPWQVQNERPSNGHWITDSWFSKGSWLIIANILWLTIYIIYKFEACQPPSLPIQVLPSGLWVASHHLCQQSRRTPAPWRHCESEAEFRF